MCVCWVRLCVFLSLPLVGLVLRVLKNEREYSESGENWWRVLCGVYIGCAMLEGSFRARVLLFVCRECTYGERVCVCVCVS